MKIIKTTEKRSCRALVGINRSGEKDSPRVMEKITDFFGENKKRAIIIACSVLMIGSAVLLNLKLFGASPEGEESPETAAPAGTAENVGGIPETELNDTYFALAVIERQRARDEAIEVLQSVVDNASSTETAKNEALAEINKLATIMATEANIETLIVAKGFEDCVAVISGEDASIVVKSDGLSVAQISQINEIVYSEAGILPVNITIIER